MCSHPDVAGSEALSFEVVAQSSRCIVGRPLWEGPHILPTQRSGQTASARCAGKDYRAGIRGSQSWVWVINGPWHSVKQPHSSLQFTSFQPPESAVSVNRQEAKQFVPTQSVSRIRSEHCVQKDGIHRPGGNLSSGRAERRA